MKKYQKNATSAMAPALPEAVSIAMAGLAGDVQEGLLALAVGTGLQVMAAMMSADVEAACGPKGKHDADRAAVRHGAGEGSVTLGGRRVPVRRPRMRATDGSGELPVDSYELFSSTEVLGRMAMGGCWPGSRRVTTRPGWNRSDKRWRRRPFDEQVRSVAALRRGDRDRVG